MTTLRAGTPVYISEPMSPTRQTRHVATVLRPMRDYGRDTASYYEVQLHNGQWRVVSADFIEIRHEGTDAREWHNVV